MFSYKFAAYFQNTFSYEHLWTATSGDTYAQLTRSGLFLVILPVIARVSYFSKITHLLIKKSFSVPRSVFADLLFDQHPIL